MFSPVWTENTFVLIQPTNLLDLNPPGFLTDSGRVKRTVSLCRHNQRRPGNHRYVSTFSPPVKFTHQGKKKDLLIKLGGIGEKYQYASSSPGDLQATPLLKCTDRLSGHRGGGDQSAQTLAFLLHVQPQTRLTAAGVSRKSVELTKVASLALTRCVAAARSVGEVFLCPRAARSGGSGCPDLTC